MENYKGHQYDNCVIENTDEESSKKLKEFWEEQGIKHNMSFCKTGIYYGLYDGKFRYLNFSDVKLLGLKIIELPQPKLKEEPKFPYLAKCYDNAEDKFDITFVVGKIEIGKPEYPFTCVQVDNIHFFVKDEGYYTVQYKYAEPINETLETLSQKVEGYKLKRDEMEREINEIDSELTYLFKLEQVLKTKS